MVFIVIGIEFPVCVSYTIECKRGLKKPTDEYYVNRPVSQT